LDGNHTIRVTFAINQYTLTPSSGANGSITPNTPVIVSSGGNQRFTFGPSTGYHLDSLIIDGVRNVDSTTGYTFTNVIANHTIRVAFAIDQYTLTPTDGGNGTINPSAPVQVNSGGSQRFTYAPSAGYHLDSLIVDGVRNVDSTIGYTFSNVTANHTIRVTFAINQYTLTPTSGANGSITPNTPAIVNSGGSQRFTFAPSVGYHLDSLIIDGVRNADSTAGYTFSNVTANHSIRVTFSILQFTVTASAGANGSIVPSGVILRNYGDSLKLVITPNAGYHISDVVVDGISVGADTVVNFRNIQANHTVIASFTITGYTITAVSGTHGTITPAGSIGINSGSDTTFTIAPDAGYRLDSLLIDGVRNVDSAATYTFKNVTANHTIRVTFAILQYTVTATAGANGSIVPSGVIVRNYGDSLRLVIRPNANYHISDVVVDGSSVGNDSIVVFTHIQANHTVAASFTISGFTITSSAGPHGTVLPLGAVNINSGSDTLFAVRPDSGYAIDTVFVDGVNKGRDSTYAFINVIANHTIRAVFARMQFTIHVTAGPGGRVLPAGNTVVSYGDSLALSIIPDSGYHCTAVVVDSVNVGRPAAYTFRNVVSNHIISATFALNHPPTAPVLVSATPDTTKSPLSRPILFVWRSSVDPDSADTLVYRLLVHQALAGGGAFDTTVSAGHDTSFSVDLAGKVESNHSPVTWTVSVTDGYFTVASADTFSIVVEGVHNRRSEIPTRYGLSQNFPNPFNPSTTIQYQLPEAGNMLLKVYDVRGRLLATLREGMESAGYHELQWNPEAVSFSSGVYFLVFRVADQQGKQRYTEVRKMLLLK
jgi:hypothetical protein